MTTRDNKTIAIPVPEIIIDKLKAEFGEETAFNKALSVVQSLIYRHQSRFAPMLEYQAYSRDHKEALLTTRFYKIWQHVVDIGILETEPYKGDVDYSYVNGLPKKYRLNPGLLNANVQETHFALPHGVANVSEDEVSQAVHENLNYVSVSERMPSERVDQIADERFEKKYHYDGGMIHYEYGKTWRKVALGESASDYYSFERINGRYALRNALEAFESGNYYVNRSDLNGRVHHNLTALPGAALSLLELDGECMVEIDMACCQPLLLAQTLEHGLTGEESVMNNPFLSSWLNTSPPILCSHMGGEVTDIDLFIDLAKRGKVYEYFAYRLYGKINKETRGNAKGIFLRTFYGRHDRATSEMLDFEKVFPRLFKLMADYKEALIGEFKMGNAELDKYRVSKSKGNKSPVEAGMDYPSVWLQELESLIFIDRVFRRLQDQGLVVVSRHDSILCKATETKAVERCVRDVLGEVFGSDGFNLRIKHLCQDEEVKLLKEAYDKHGYVYRLEARTPSAAVYAQHDAGNGGRIAAYEVFRIKVRSAEEFKGRWYPRREKFPADSDFGTTAWSKRDMASAVRDMLEIEFFGKRLDEGDDPIMARIISELLEL